MSIIHQQSTVMNFGVTYSVTSGDIQSGVTIGYRRNPLVGVLDPDALLFGYRVDRLQSTVSGGAFRVQIADADGSAPQTLWREVEWTRQGGSQTQVLQSANADTFFAGVGGVTWWEFTDPGNLYMWVNETCTMEFR